MTLRGKQLLYAALGALAVYFLFIRVVAPQAQLRTSICGSCHATSPQFQSWRKSPHAKITCSACHSEPGIGGMAINGLRNARNFVAWARGNRDAAEAWMNEDNCLSCHDKVLFQNIVKHNVVMSHKEVIKASWKCGRCHAAVGHESKFAPGSAGKPTMDTCFTCHKKGGTASAKCSACHISAKGLFKKKPDNPDTMGTIAHIPAWRTSHGLADPSSCKQCHDTAFCVTCHKTPMPHPEEWTTFHGKEAKKLSSTTDPREPTPCYQCHDKQDFCDNCHREPMPHQLPYLHKPEVTTVQRVCFRCHYGGDCQNCHRTHHSKFKRPPAAP